MGVQHSKCPNFVRTTGKIHKCAILRDFLAPFSLYHVHALFSRIISDNATILRKKWKTVIKLRH